MAIVRKPCPRCSFPCFRTWKDERPEFCQKCRGSGRFIRGGRDYGPCFACQGKGFIKNTCPECGGCGTVCVNEPEKP